jgi:hypothetical protein
MLFGDYLGAMLGDQFPLFPNFCKNQTAALVVVERDGRHFSAVPTGTAAFCPTIPSDKSLGYYPQIPTGSIIGLDPEFVWKPAGYRSFIQKQRVQDRAN